MPTTIFTKQQTDAAPEPVSESNPLHVKNIDEDPINAAGIFTVDSLVTGGPALLHWITVSNIHATATATIQLFDATAGSEGVQRWSIYLDAVDGATGAVHAIFVPPIKFSIGIYFELTGGTVIVVPGFTSA